MTTPKQALASADPGLVFLVICIVISMTTAVAFGGLS